MPTRRFSVNNAPQQTLASGINATATTFTIQSSFAGWPTAFPYFAVLEAFTANEEIVLVTGVVGLVATCTRAQDGSTAVTHNAGATVDQMFVHQDADEANAHTSANSGVHGISGNVVGDSDVQTLTNKTLTSPTVNGGTVSAPTLSGAVNLTGTGLRKDTFNAVHVYTSGTPTWTKPARLLGVHVRVCGGGGGSGGVTGAGTGNAVSGGGGGGGYSEAWIPAASLGATETVTVGAGGTAGSNPGGNGGTGGTSSFGAHCQATGGAGGVAMTSTTGNQKATAGGGGAGSGGDINVPGSDGLHGNVHGGSWDTNSGYGGGNPLAPSTAVNNTGLNSPQPGQGYGGGAAGALASTTGGGGAAGAAGVVIVEELYY